MHLFLFSKLVKVLLKDGQGMDNHEERKNEKQEIYKSKNVSIGYYIEIQKYCI